MHSHRNKPLCALVLFVLAGCNYPLASPAGTPEAWIDSPLNGVSLPLGPVKVVWHAAALGGVALVEFGVNGSPVEVVPPSAAGGAFVMGEQGWVPAAAGTYVLHVRAQGQNGAWGAVRTAQVIVLGEQPPEPGPSPTSTTTPENTPTSTATATATATLAVTTTPTPAAQASIERIRISTDRVSYEGGGGCAPMEVSIVVRAVDPAGIEAVVLFYRIRNKDSGEATEFFSRAMNSQGGDLFSIAINPAEDIISHVGFPGSGEAWLQYQAVLQNVRGETITRTTTLSDITVVGC